MVGWKFATYLRDTATNLDYADQRFYANTQGRFTSPDPLNASARMANPNSWNRYAYVEGDPINANDPSGTITSATAVSGWCPVGVGENKVNVPCVMLQIYDNNMNDALAAEWDNLPEQCQKGLKAKYGKASIKSMLANLNRGIAMLDTLEKAGNAHGIDAALLAAIALKESNFINKAEVDGAGLGVGIFQITVNANSGVTARQASDPAWAADWAAKYLSSNRAYLAGQFPKFTGDELLQATAASFNLGPGRFSGNPATIDVGSMGTPENGYGANVVQLMECFR